MIENLKKTTIYLLLLLSLVLSVSPMLLDSIIIIITTLISVIIVVKDKKKSLKILLKDYSLFFLFFSILVLGLLYTSDLERGLMQVEKNLAFLVLPICFYSISEKINYKKFLSAFSYGVVISAIFCDIFLKINHNSFFSFGYSILLEPLDLDPTYFCLYAILALSFFFTEIKSQKKYRTFNICLLLYLLFFYLRVGSKIGVVMLFVLVLIFLVSTFKKIRWLYVLYTLIALGSLIVITYNIPLIYERFYAPFLKNNFDLYQLRLKFFNERYYTWKCSINALNLKSLWFGYGTGDDQNTLISCYENYRKSFKLNPHSIYFSSLIKNGIIGLISTLLLATLGFKTKNLEYIIFSISILCIGLSESILERQKGIIYFAFICTLIVTQLKQKNKCVE